MRRALKYFSLILLGIFVLIQFFQPDRSNPPVRAEIDAPPAVKAVLRESCYDCHSNETVWPWYSYINPFAYLLADHVQEGREHMNFSAWGHLDAQKRYKLKQEILEEIEEGEMPLPSYLLLHGDAELSGEDRATIERWVQEPGR